MTAEPPSGRAPDADNLNQHGEDVYGPEAAARFYRDAVERWTQEPDAIEQLVANNIRIAAERDEYKARALAAEGVLVDAPALTVKERERAERLELVVAEYRASLADFLEQSQGEHMFPALVLAAMRDRWVASLSKLDPDQRGASILESVETIRQLDAAREALAASQAREQEADILTARRVDQLVRIERVVDRWRLMTPEQMFERIMVVLRGEQPTRPDEPKGEG